MDRRVLARESPACVVLAAALLTACGRSSDHAAPACEPGVGSVALVGAAHRVLPSVVAVLSEGEPDSRNPDAVPLALGSGVTVMPDGIILTSDHVVAGARKIYVATQDGHRYEAQLVGADSQTDLAVLRIPARGLPAIAVADSSQLEIGQLVLAVGTPFGLGQTVTLGIVSGLGRSTLGITHFDDFIQTDAAINPGSSGGALVDTAGRLVGINTAIVSRSGGYEGIGFAVPSSLALRVAGELVKYGHVERGWLGIAVDDLTHGMPGRGAGVVVSDVELRSPAAAAGLRPGDVLLAFGRTQAVTAAQARDELTLYRPGTVLSLKVRRGKQVLQPHVRVGTNPSGS